MARRFEDNVPPNLAQKVRKHMKACGYSQGTIDMRIGNLGYLFDVYGTEKLVDLLLTDQTNVDDAVQYVSDNLPAGGVHSSDVQAFKFAWESINGREIFTKRVRP